MKTAGKDILTGFQKRWQLQLWLEVCLYALGAGVLVYFLSLNMLWAFLTFLVVGIVAAGILRPWEVSLENISSFIDTKLETAEFSSGLLLIPQDELSGMARLQQQKVSVKISEKIKSVQPENHLEWAAVVSVLLMVTGFVIYQFGLLDKLNPSHQQSQQEETVVFKRADSTSAEITPPALQDQQVTIHYPAYTGVPAYTSEEMKIKAVEGSRVTWKIAFDAEVDSVQLESMGTAYSMNFSKGAYSRTSSLNNSGFYSFRFSDTAGTSYVSDLYSIEVIKDRSPMIEVPELKQFTSYNFDDEKELNFKALISDDFGIGQAYIIATVSKGAGESVKFREEKLSFNGQIEKGSRSLEVSKNIDLDDLQMEVGDELYFYVEAVDLKQPTPNRSRSETYFAVIRDTVSYGEGVEGTLGVDLMPDYFRSQRQLIIDTEKLISQRGKIPEKEFNSTSNNLGFDQKSLRLKYGQFMGDESEGGLEVQNEQPKEDHVPGEEDLLAEYTHDHDGSNEHNLVPEEHEEHGEEKAEDPLAEYLHNHSDPEESTLFADNLKSKLRQALDIMWDAELHLRMYEPEKSLPYQYQALALIQEIKNSARIYVHRIGFDPPPIKEEVRLTGNIDEVSNYQKSADLETPEEDPFMRKAVQRLEQLISRNIQISAEDRKLFEQAGNELAEKAIEEPGRYLNTLQQLKWLTEERKTGPQVFWEVQRGLLNALSKPEANPGKGSSFSVEINKLLLKELELNDR